ncbi:MAG: AmmeMemoRadiSam system protein B [Anaerolineae bacterium]
MVTQSIRSPAVAGAFYPGTKAALKHSIQDYLSQADPPDLTGVRAVIVPHAGYIYSGPIAAFSYKVLAKQAMTPARVYLMGPAHRAWFPGIALADFAALRTPLGDAPVDGETLQDLAEQSNLFKPLPGAHANEHSLEVQIPFLQVIYEDMPPLVPMLFGNVDPTAVGEVLNEALSANDITVVSSDLSHYHSYDEARRKDRAFVDAVLHHQKREVASGEACGQAPILALMTLAEKQGWEPQLLDYRNSGDTGGGKGQVVGYAAIAYLES